jgi:hypothetical protein
MYDMVAKRGKGRRVSPKCPRCRRQDVRLEQLQGAALLAYATSRYRRSPVLLCGQTARELGMALSRLQHVAVLLEQRGQVRLTSNDLGVLLYPTVGHAGSGGRPGPGAAAPR